MVPLSATSFSLACFLPLCLLPLPALFPPSLLFWGPTNAALSATCYLSRHVSGGANRRGRRHQPPTYLPVHQSKFGSTTLMICSSNMQFPCQLTGWDR
ncbi:hypothetical protein R3P38DRAFT_3091682 [Favolaschia claudopus]|uniref:Secreted protein n=1 Tax=Favolaschia claudopus TaxID=2862362 RepID=A0AAV9ZRY6_9AGAR